jgi:hypothetical protein
MNKDETKQGDAPAVAKNEVQITKMSVKGLGCNPGSLTRMCQIMGKAIGVKTGEDATGRVWSALIGDFRGVNLETGEVFRSGKLFLPSGIHEPIEAAVKGLGDKGGEGVVKFALELRTVKASNPIGYSYQAVTLLPITAETDSLADLIAAVPEVKLLAALAEPAKKK